MIKRFKKYKAFAFEEPFTNGNVRLSAHSQCDRYIFHYLEYDLKLLSQIYVKFKSANMLSL